MDASKPNLEDIELQLLLEGIYQYYGFDLRNYARSSLKRRVRKVLKIEGLSQISALQSLVLHDPEAMRRMLLEITVNVTSMFRDPSFFLAFRQQVVPLLYSYPYIRLWHAGCSEGQEVYAMAILLQEAGLYHRCRIYATDSNERVLEAAKSRHLSAAVHAAIYAALFAVGRSAFVFRILHGSLRQRYFPRLATRKYSVFAA